MGIASDISPFAFAPPSYRGYNTAKVLVEAGHKVFPVLAGESRMEDAILLCIGLFIASLALGLGSGLSRP